MAKQGSFGAYSSVPTTTGMGQGSAQVFTPQAGQLDTTAIQRGVQALGQGISDAAAKKEAAAKAKAKAEADAKLNERKAGQYNYNEAAMNMATDEIQKKYINGEIDFAEYNEQINRFTKNTEGIRQFETGVLQPEQQKFVTDENARAYGEDGGWDTYANRTDYLSGDLDETAIELIKEDPTLGKFNAYQQSKYRDVQKNFGKYDPDFSLAGAAFSDASWSDFKNSQDKVTRAAIEDAERQGYDKKTIVSTTIGSDKFKEHLKQRPDIMGKWVQQQKFNENLSPEYIQKLFSEDMSPLVTEAYGEEIEKLILPSTGKETKIDFVKAPTEANAAKIALENIANSPVITSIKTENGEEKTVMGTTYNLDEVMPIDFRDKETGKMVKGQGKVTRTFQDKDGQMYMEFIPFVDKESGGLDFTGVPEEYRGAAVITAAMMGKGAADSKYVLDPKQKRTIPISDKDINYDALVGAVAKSAKASREDAAMRIKSFGEKRLIEEGGATNIFGEPIKGGKSYRIVDSNDNKTTVELYGGKSEKKYIASNDNKTTVELYGGKSEKKYIASNGYAYTKQQLIDANYTEEDIKSLKTQ